MTSVEKWVLWLKTTLITVIFILLLLEVFIVSNEALKILGNEPIRVSCASGAMKLGYGNSEVQLGPSVFDLQKCACFAENNPAVLVPPFNLINLVDKLLKFFLYG